MNAQTLLNEFDLIAEAPGGVAKLRQLILQLAIRGRLVPNNPKEGLSGAELKELRSPENEPYSIPENWRWTTLRSISKELGQKVPDAPFTYIDVSAIDSEKGCIGGQVQILGPANAPSRARKLVDLGTVIYSTVRPYLLNIAVVEQAFEPAPIVSTAFFVMHPFKSVASRFLFHYLRSDSFTTYVQGAMTGMAYPAINDAKMSVAPFPLPPLAEQKRIVAQVDELMKRCDDLEARQKDRNERRTAMTAACLHAVTSTVRKSAASEIRRVLDSFPLLIDTPESVAELRKTILQLAVQGRLVPQDPKEQPARIHSRSKKDLLVPSQAVSCNIDFGPPDVLPPGWVKTRLGEIGEWGAGATPSRSNSAYYGGHIPWFKSGELNDNQNLIESKEFVTDKALQECSLRLNEPGDVLIAMYGATIGKLAILGCRATTNQAVCACTCNEATTNRYLFILLRALRPFFSAQGAGGAQPNISKVKIVNTWFPLPPYAEQKRIVVKVHALFAMCDALEAMLAQSRNDADTLAAAIVHHFCNGGARRVEATV